MSTSKNYTTSGGIRITLFFTIVSACIQFVSLITLARLISPEAFGQFAFASAIVSLTILVINNICERALLITPDFELTSSVTPALFLITSLSGIVVWSGAVVTGFVLKSSLVDTLALGLVITASVLSSMAIQTRVRFRRDLNFFPVALADTASLLMGFLAGLFLSLKGAELFALTSVVLTQSLGSLVIISFFRLQFYPKVESKGAHPKKSPFMVVRKAGRLALLIILETAYVQVPSLFVGQIGAKSLGVFTRVSNLVQVPSYLLISSISRVLVSSFVQHREDYALSKQVLSKALRISVAITGPICFGMAGSANELISVFLGSQWIAGTSLVNPLAAVIFLNLLGVILAVFIEAHNWLVIKLQIQLASTLLLIFGLAATLQFGLFWMVMTLPLVGVIFATLNVAAIVQRKYISIFEVARCIFPGLVAGCLCYGVTSWLGASEVFQADFYTFVVQVSSCAVVVVSTYLALFRTLTFEIVRALFPSQLGIRITKWLGLRLT